MLLNIMKHYIILFILLVGLFILFYKTNPYKPFNEGYSSIIPMNCDDPNNNTNLLRYDCR